MVQMAQFAEQARHHPRMIVVAGGVLEIASWRSGRERMHIEPRKQRRSLLPQFHQWLHLKVCLMTETQSAQPMFCLQTLETVLELKVD